MEEPFRPFSTLIDELKSRNVFRVALTYIAVAFAGLQGMDLVLSPLGAGRAYRWIVLATLAGFPVALVLAWYFDLRRAVGQRPGAQTDATVVKPRARNRRRRVAVISVLILAGVGLYGYRVVVPPSVVAAAAETIAVAPFTAVGGASSALGEGIGRLLATNLDQVGGLRTLDPTRVLRAWHRGGTEEHADDEALALGRELGASSVLIGDVVEAGYDVRLTAVLKSVGGKPIARAQVTGPADNVLLLADSLSNRLLREIWRAHSPVPQLRIAAITTSDLDAIRAYLEGERYYRQLRWDSAKAALERAVEADSTFALAHRRLSDVYSWSDYESALRARHEQAAFANAARLPERERALAVAYMLWHEKHNHQAALDSLDAHLRRYSDDAEALHLRAEVLLHGVSDNVWNKDPATLLSAFEAALRVDPGLAPAMLHPLELSVTLHDTVRLRTYATRLLRARGVATAALAPTADSLMDVLWRGKPDRGLLHRLHNGTEPGFSIVWPLPIVLRAGRDPQPILDAMLADLDRASPQESIMLLMGLFTTGRLTDANLVMRKAAPNPQIEWQLRATAVVFGVAPASFVPRVWPKPEVSVPPGTESLQAASQAIIDFSTGDTASVVKALAAARTGPTLPPVMDALVRLTEGRLRIARGDVAGGLTRMEQATRDALNAPPNPKSPPALFNEILLAIAHAGNADTRDRGIGELQHQVIRWQMTPFSSVLRMHLARALEAAGQRNAAVKEYVAFVDVTQRAEGPLARMRAEAQAALVRLKPRG